MEKGKYGICLWFYAVTAFVLAFLGQVLLCGLLLGFVIAAEKNEWLTKQVIQAFFLALFSAAIGSILDILNIFNQVPILGSILGTMFNIVMGLVSIVILVFVIIGIVKTAKGQDAGVPGFSALANRAYGFVARKVYQAPQNPQGPNSGMPQ